MSGRKYSSYTLTNDRERVFRLQRNLKNVTDKIAVIMKECDELQQNISSHFRQRFPSIIKKLGEWHDRAIKFIDNVSTPPSEESILRTTITSAQDLQKNGEQLIAQCQNEWFRFQQRVSFLKDGLDQLREEFETRKELLTHWNEEESRLYQHKLNEIETYFRKGEIERAESLLSSLADEIDQAIHEATIEQYQSTLKLLMDEAERVRHQFRTISLACPEGYRDTFSNTFAKADSWIQKVSSTLSRARQALTSQSEQTYEENIRLLEQTLEEGKEILSDLSHVVYEEGPLKQNQLRRRIRRIRHFIDQHKTILESWTSEETRRIQHEISEIEQLLREGFLNACESKLDKVTQDFEKILDRAKQLDQAHQKRLYVIEALQKVCSSLGFECVEGPVYEEAGNLKSRIKVVYDTFTQGYITFYFSLDEIEVDSQVEGSHCYDEFTKLSKELEEAFGVLTKFEGEHMKKPPRLKTSDAKAEPRSKDKRR